MCKLQAPTSKLQRSSNVQAPKECRVRRAKGPKPYQPVAQPQVRCQTIRKGLKARLINLGHEMKNSKRQHPSSREAPKECRCSLCIVAENVSFQQAEPAPITDALGLDVWDLVLGISLVLGVWMLVLLICLDWRFGKWLDWVRLKGWMVGCCFLMASGLG